jgi:hypothetical protein
MKKSSANHFSPRAGKREIRRPVWKAGPISFRGICRGNKSRRSTRSTRAKKKSSQSETRRSPNSNLASECRVMDQPINCSLLAIFSCDQRRLSRHLRTCRPTRLSPVFINRWQGSGFQTGQLFPRWAQVAKKSACLPTGKAVRDLCVGKKTSRPNEKYETRGGTFFSKSISESPRARITASFYFTGRRAGWMGCCLLSCVSAKTQRHETPFAEKLWLLSFYLW